LLDAALAWFAERPGCDDRATAPGVWADDAAFQRAVWREYLFVHAVSP
jgi:hypothetical protein